MNIFTQKRIALWTIILLVVLNLSILTMVWMGSRKQSPLRKQNTLPMGGGPPAARTLALLQEELGFSDAQIQQYDLLRQEHFKKTRPLIMNMLQLKKEMMDEVMTGHPDSAKIAETAATIGRMQGEVEHLTYQHILSLKTVCGETQVKQLHMLVQAFFQKKPPQGMEPPMHGEGRPMHPPPRHAPN